MFTPTYFSIVVITFIEEVLESKGLDVEMMRGMLQNQEDAIRKEAEKILRETAESLWKQVEHNINIVSEMLNDEFPDEKIDYLVVDKVLKTLTLNVSILVLYSYSFNTKITNIGFITLKRFRQTL